MKLNRYPSLARAASALKKRGFSEQFIMKQNTLRHRQSGQLYDPEEVAIVEYHRFFPRDPQSNQVAIIFALETVDGKLGLLRATYNAFGKVNLLEFMDRVKIKARREKAV